MTRNEVRILPLGLYRLFWKVGGASVASVGYDAAGNRWYAPANWIGSVPCFDWSTVKSAHMIAPALCYEEPAEDEQEDTLPASRSPEQQEPGKAGAFEETLANCDSLVDVFSQYGISGYGLKAIKAVLAWARSRTSRSPLTPAEERDASARLEAMGFRAAEPKGAPRRIENTSARMPRVPPEAVAKALGALHDAEKARADFADEEAKRAPDYAEPKGAGGECDEFGPVTEAELDGARVELAAARSEPSDAEVEAAAEALRRRYWVINDDAPFPALPWREISVSQRANWCDMARAALSAARPGARGSEEGK